MASLLPLCIPGIAALILCTRSLPTFSTYFAIFPLSFRPPLFARINRLDHLVMFLREIILRWDCELDSCTSGQDQTPGINLELRK